jgi:hypothetical protein
MGKICDVCTAIVLGAALIVLGMAAWALASVATSEAVFAKGESPLRFTDLPATSPPGTIIDFVESGVGKQTRIVTRIYDGNLWYAINSPTGRALQMYFLVNR